MSNKYSLKVNPLEKKQIKEIAEIEKEVMFDPWSKDSFLSSLNDFSIAFVAQYGDEVAGYIWGQRIENEAEIFKIAVAERFQRRGIGKILLEEFIKYCRKSMVMSIYLEVSSMNLNAINLYKNQGFTENGRRKNYYGLSNDALLLTCRL